MKIILKDIQEILNDKFTLSQRGILITILLVRESDEKLTLAKFKAKVKIAEAKEDLINLHKAGVIEWSGYSAAIKSLEESKEMLNARYVLGFMNSLCKTNFNYLTKGHNKELLARLKTYDVETVKKVVANRYSAWKDDSYMNKYLRPSTIFNASKFEIYLEEAERTKTGESFLNASKIGLNDGDLVTLDIAKTFSDKDTYSIQTFNLVDGQRSGNGYTQNMLGKDIKVSLQVQDNNLQYSPKDFEYVYKQK